MSDDDCEVVEDVTEVIRDETGRIIGVRKPPDRQLQQALALALDAAQRGYADGVRGALEQANAQLRAHGEDCARIGFETGYRLGWQEGSTATAKSLRKPSGS